MNEKSFKEQRIRKITQLYYSRPDVQQAIFEFSKNREIVPRYFDGFGKRPDSLQYKGDIFELVKKGATSFNCSEEIWQDPLKIETGMDAEELDKIRIGWDLVLDVDCKWFDYSKLATQAIIKTLEIHGVKNLGVKFSVSGDTPILIKDNKEEISLIAISEAINKIKKKEKIKVLSLDKNRKLKFSKIYDFLEHKDTIYELKHSQSTLPIKVTKHHSVFIWDKGEILQKKVSEIKKGDFLISYNAKENPFSKEKIEITNKFKFNKKIIKKEIKITKELMRLIGYFLAEGHVTNIINQTGFTFHKDEVEYIEDVKNLLKILTKRKISIRHPNINSTQILIHSKEWATFFDNFCGKKKNKHIPKFAFQCPKKLFLELLKGYIRGDGYKIGEYGIVAKSVSKKLITDFIWLCKLNGISCNLSWEQNKPHKLPQGKFFKGSLVYMLRIPKSELENLEFHRKRNKFSPYAGDKVFPVDGLKLVYKQIRPKMFNSHRSEQMTLNKKQANLNRIRRVLNWFYNFKEIEPDEISRKILFNYEKIFDADITTMQIKEIVKKEKELVYDVSVEETESFFGNYYPALLHNSGSKGFHIIVPWKAFPKEINGIPTQKMFPEIPRKLARYIAYYSEKILKKTLPDDFYKQFKDVKINRGYRCKNCGAIAKETKEVEFHCEPCEITEIKKFSAEQKIPETKCYQCKKQMQSKILNKNLSCPKCNQWQEGFEEVVQIDLFELIGLDIGLVSPRHLFRMPYSLHEKTALASAVIDPKKIQEFEMKNADPMKVKIKNFLPNSEPGEAKNLLIQALDWTKENEIRTGNSKQKIQGKYADFKPIQLKNLTIQNFPPCILKILNGLKDGKKRALFILINLFRSIGMDKQELEKKIYDWNKKNNPPLKQGYVQTQLSWSYRKKPILPPNCKEFYQGIGICIPDNLCNLIKNPVNYVVKKNFHSNKVAGKK